MKVLREYKPIIYHLKVTWNPPSIGHQKCNTNGTNRDNPSPSSYGFCIRDHRGDLYYAQAGKLGQKKNVQAEAQAFLEAVRYWEAEV